MQLYVYAKSKTAVNKKLKAGQKVYGENHSFFDKDEVKDLTLVPNGTVIKIYENIISGSPYAKAYGIMKNGVLT